MHCQNDSSDASSDESMEHPVSMKEMAKHRRRSSTEEPLDIFEDIQEFTRLHKALPECNIHVDNMIKLVTAFENDYSRAIYYIFGAGVGAAAGLALSFITVGLSAVATGIAALFGVVYGQFKKEQQNKNVRKSFEDELTELQTKISPVIDVLQKLFKRTQKILRDSSMQEPKVVALCERLSFCFHKIKLLKTDDNIKVTAQMLKSEFFSKHVSEIFREMNSLLEILKEIVEQEPDDKKTGNPTETSTHKQMDKEKFKEKAEQFIKQMKKGIDQVQNVINEIDQINKRISHRFH